MKKFLLLAMVFSMALASPAWAFDFTFHGTMWNTVATTNNAAVFSNNQKSGSTNFFGYKGNLNTAGAKKYNFMDDELDDAFGVTKARLRFEGTTDDGRARFVYGLEVGSYNWGDSTKKAEREYGFGLSGDGVNIETRFAYVDLEVPVLGPKHHIRAGLQSTKINHWVWTETAPGVSYYGKNKNWDWKLAWFRGDAVGYDSSVENDYFVAKFGYKAIPQLGLGLFYIHEDAESETATLGGVGVDYDYINNYVGLTGKIKSGPVFGNFDVISQTGDIDFHNNPDLNREAWLGNLTLGYKVTDRFKLTVNGLYVSGDDDPNDGDAENFDSIDVDVKIGQIFFKDSLLGSCDRFFSDGPYVMDKGLINIALQGEYQLAKAHNVRLAVRQLWTAEDLAYQDGSGREDDDLGTEMDFWYAYKYNKYVKLRFEAAYLFEGDGTDALTDTGDADSLYYLASGIMFRF